MVNSEKSPTKTSDQWSLRLLSH